MVAEVRKIPIVGVMGSGTHDHRDWVAPVGEMLGRRAVHLLTGGGKGVMSAVAQAYTSIPDRIGLSLGILPAATENGDPRVGYPNPWIEVPILTHLTGLEQETSSRNHINILTADVVLIMPGEKGTTAESHLCTRYDAKAMAYLPSRDFMPGLANGVPWTSELEELEAFLDGALDQ